ncbi:hypothetical protein DMENIID0001_088720 [Sergentomyia squamirostris]
MPVTWLCLLGLIFSVATVSSSSGDVFTSSFLVRFKRNIDNDVAHEIANKYGYDNLGSVSKTTIYIYPYFFFFLVYLPRKQSRVWVTVGKNICQPRTSLFISYNAWWEYN